jgi:hypothetical protein
MRYFHRTSLSPDLVLEEADKYFPARVNLTDSGRRHRSYAGSVGSISLRVEAEGGHYTLVTVETDQVGESVSSGSRCLLTDLARSLLWHQFD